MKRALITSLFSLLMLNIIAQSREFVAMEYVGGIGNRILKVWITDSLIFAAKVKGLTSETTSFPGINNSEMVVPNESRANPNSYINKVKELSYSEINFDNITPAEFLKINPSNFVIKKSGILEFYHNPKKKWGMGGYPHNGRIFIVSTPTEFNRKKKREFILIGRQDEKPILKWIQQQ